MIVLIRWECLLWNSQGTYGHGLSHFSQHVVTVGPLTFFFPSFCTGRTGQASEASSHHPARVHAHGPGTQLASSFALLCACGSWPRNHLLCTRWCLNQHRESLEPPTFWGQMLLRHLAEQDAAGQVVTEGDLITWWPSKEVLRKRRVSGFWAGYIYIYYIYIYVYTLVLLLLLLLLYYYYILYIIYYIIYYYYYY